MGVGLLSTMGLQSVMVHHIFSQDDILKILQNLNLNNSHVANKICDVLRNLVPFVQSKKRKKQPWRSVTFSLFLACNFIKSNTPPWAFFKFFKLYN